MLKLKHVYLIKLLRLCRVYFQRSIVLTSERLYNNNRADTLTNKQCAYIVTSVCVLRHQGAPVSLLATTQTSQVSRFFVQRKPNTRFNLKSRVCVILSYKYIIYIVNTSKYFTMSPKFGLLLTDLPQG